MQRKGKGPKASGFNLTINTNRTDEETRDRLVRAVDGMLHNFHYFIKQGPRETDPAWGEKIHHMGCRVALETNQGKTGYNMGYHVHAFIVLIHETNIHLDLANIRRHLRDEIGYTPYLNARVINMHAWNTMNYLEKDPQVFAQNILNGISGSSKMMEQE